MTEAELRGAIASLDRPARQRNTLYGWVEAPAEGVAAPVAAGNTVPARQSRSQSRMA
jgi:FO synthase subunit 2